MRIIMAIYTDVHALIVQGISAVSLSVSAAPVVNTSTPVEPLKTFHRVELRVCLEVPRFPGNTAGFVDVQDSLLRLQGETLASGYIGR